jgi:hypothetical protein
MTSMSTRLAPASRTSARMRTRRRIVERPSMLLELLSTI